MTEIVDLKVKKKEPTPEDPEFWMAVGAAIVDEEVEAWTPVRDPGGHLSRGHEAFTRAHVALLRDCGATRQDVLDYAAQARPRFNKSQLRKLEADLGSYGL